MKLRCDVENTAVNRALDALQWIQSEQKLAQEHLQNATGFTALLAEEIKRIKERAAKIPKESPEPFHKLGDRYISEKDIQAAISNGIQTATQELVAKLASLDAPKKGKA
jgi:hypothetical protein